MDILDLLASDYGVYRYEITNYRSKIHPPEGGMPGKAHLSIYHPFMYVATTRQCLFRTPPLEQDSPLPNIHCEVPCREHSFRLQYPDIIDEPIYLKGNTLFVSFDEMSYANKELLALHADRVVFSRNLPV
jgi:hypothetical protein